MEKVNVNMTEKKEYVEVTVKVPKRLMQMLEDQKYFGWAREEFFTFIHYASFSEQR